TTTGGLGTIQFVGGVGTVTGSMHLLPVNHSRILLECGLFQGRRQEAFERNRHLPFDAASLDAMVLSHANIDHSGNIPNLVRSGYGQSIYATFATRDLCSYMLRDSAHIMESDIAYVNKLRRRDGLPPAEPIYTAEDALRSLTHFIGMDYGRPLWIAPGVRLTFYDAGHILGSAFCALDVTEDGRSYRLLFTGDVGRPGMPILRDPQVVPNVDYLIIESTYGDRLHGTLEDAERQLARVVNATHGRGGKLIIPAFSVGRTQEIVYALHRLARAGQIPQQPVYVDSPLSINATEVFRLHPEYYDEETLRFLAEHDDPFGFAQLRYVRYTEESKTLNDLPGPMIVITASGMCESGRVLHHLKHNIEDSRNTVLLVSFQAEHTLGRRIEERQETVPIFGERYQLRAQVEKLDGYSAHADRDELLGLVRQLGPQRLKRAFVVHGEPATSLAFEQSLRAIGVGDTHVPAPGDEVTL
ncbi:MAG: MBL fold metallo-hydrolase, partial [Chloroflexota bacterium]